MARVLIGTVLAVALAGGAAMADATGARTAAPANPQLTATPRVVAPGGTVVLKGRGFPRRARIALLAGPPRSEAVRVGGARTGARGTFTARIRIRSRAAAGRLVALACYDRCRVKAAARFRIAAP